MKAKKKIELDGLWLVDLGVYLPQSKTLAIADLHLGYEEALKGEGIFIPRLHLRQVKKRLERIFKLVRTKKIIINGDLNHAGRGGIAESLELIEFLLENVKEIILIKGNHDRIDLNVVTKKFHQEGDFLFIHGDLVLDIPPVKTIVIGHEHPAVSLRDRITGRREIYKCFLKGRFGDKELLVQPSFNLLIKGSDLTKEETISPFITLDDLEVFAVSDNGEIYRFGSFWWVKELL
jgi:hypothetical protein